MADVSLRAGAVWSHIVRQHGLIDILGGTASWRSNRGVYP